MREMREMRKLKVALLTLGMALVIGLTSSQTWAIDPVVCNKQDRCNELARTKLLAKFQKALLAQQALMQAQQLAQGTINEYNEEMKATVKAEGQPEGTTYALDAGNGTVTAQAPAQPAPTTPAKPADSAKPAPPTSPGASGGPTKGGQK